MLLDDYSWQIPKQSMCFFHEDSEREREREHPRFTKVTSETVFPIEIIRNFGKLLLGTIWLPQKFTLVNQPEFWYI